MTQASTGTHIGLVVAPERVQLLPGARGSVVLLVTNNSPVVDQLSLAVEGLDPGWFTITPSVVNVLPDVQDRFELELHIPDDPSVTAATQDVVLSVVGQADPLNPARLHLPVEVLQQGTVELQLRPQRVTVGLRRPGRFSVGINNGGNADRIVDLVVEDPSAELDLRFDRDRIPVDAASRAEAVLFARPRKRPLAARERSYPFSLRAIEAPEVADTDGVAGQVLGVLQGEVIYAAPLAMLVPFLPSLRRALLALGALALALAVLIWVVGEPGRASAFVQRVPAAQPAVAAAQDAYNAAASAANAVTGPTPPAAQPPEIKKFELATPGQDGRADYALVWEVDGADQVTIDGAAQPNPTSGSLHLDKLTNAEHTLEASKGGVSVNQSVGIVVLRAPDIQRFVATPATVAPGGSAQLEWRAVRGDRASIGDKTVDPASGSMSVSPGVTTSYTLVVENELGRSQQTVEVNVIAVTPTPAP